LAPILAQRSSARTKAQENEFEHKLQQEEREAPYTNLNTEMRNFHRALNNYLHLIRSGESNDGAQASLEEVRRRYHQNYSDAQMIVSDDVLATAARANAGLMRLYGIARRLDNYSVADLSADVTEAGKETTESAFVFLEEVRRTIAQTRDMMRKELGVSTVGDSSKTGP
jgi:hypothetical protein